jgi:hypothetical protein
MTKRLFLVTDVRYGSGTDILGTSTNIPFTPQSGYQRAHFRGPVCAKAGIEGALLAAEVCSAGAGSKRRKRSPEQTKIKGNADRPPRGAFSVWRNCREAESPAPADDRVQTQLGPLLNAIGNYENLAADKIDGLPRRLDRPFFAAQTPVRCVKI